MSHAQTRPEVLEPEVSERDGPPRRKSTPEERKRARKRRMRERAGRVEGEKPTLVQLAREYWRAAILRVGKDNRKRVNRVLARYSLVGDPNYFESEQFPFMKGLEDNWEVIRSEAEALLKMRDLIPAISEISPDHDRLNNDGGWKALFLHGWGNHFEKVSSRCPETAKLIETIPNLNSAFFSILTPGSHLPRHKGPTKAIITWHLGLVIPDEREKCWIEVSRERRSWEAGKSLVFDDAQRHEVHNDTDQQRVVLLVHFGRPMRAPGSWLGRAVLTAIRLSPFVRDGVRNQRAWERIFEEEMAERAANRPRERS